MNNSLCIKYYIDEISVLSQADLWNDNKSVRNNSD